MDAFNSLNTCYQVKKQRHCDSIPKKSTVFATGCENIRKEVERRREEKQAARSK